MLAIADDRETLDFLGHDDSAAEAFLDWIVAAEWRLAALGAQPLTASRVDALDRPTTKVDRVWRDAPETMRQSVAHAEDVIGVLEAAIPSSGNIAISALRLPLRLAEVAQADLVDDSRLVTAARDTTAQSRIVAERRDRIHHDITSLQQHGLLEPSVADRLTSRHPEPDVLRTIFAGAGSVSPGRAVFVHTNSYGQTYFLHQRDVTLKGGRVRRIHFFSRVLLPGAIASMPDGYVVAENPRTGLPILKKG